MLMLNAPVSRWHTIYTVTPIRKHTSMVLFVFTIEQRGVPLHTLDADGTQLISDGRTSLPVYFANNIQWCSMELR